MTARLYLPNLDASFTDADLTNYFSQFGHVDHCVRKLRTPPRWGLVIFSEQSGVDRALLAAPHFINGILVRAERSRETSIGEKISNNNNNAHTIRIQNHGRLDEHRLRSYCESFGTLSSFNYRPTSVLLSFLSPNEDQRFLDLRPHMINGTILRVTDRDSPCFPVSNSAFVTCISEQINEYLLYEHFSTRYGRVINCAIVKKDTGHGEKQSSFGFLSFANEKDLDTLLNDEMTRQQQHRIKPHLSRLRVQRVLASQ